MRRFSDHFIYSKAWSYRLARHLLFWLVYFLVFRVMIYAGPGFAAFVAACWFLPVNMLFVYMVAYRLVPRLLMRFAYWSFFAWYCTCLVLCLTLDFYWGESVVYRLLPVAPYNHPHGIWHTFTTIFDPGMFTVVNCMAGLCIGVKMYKFWRAEVWLKWQTGQEKARAELELLKGQLQPHFLYNSLAHLHTLVTEGSGRAPQMLLRLSAVLSYILYECRADEVPLDREIAICKEYIALERERHSRWLDVSVDSFGLPSGLQIAPMLLLPFVEDAFPRQWDSTRRSWIAFEFSVEEHRLLLRIIQGPDLSDGTRSAHEEDTRARPELREHSGKQGGAGRLQMLYPGRHWISRKSGEDTEIVALTIDLHHTDSRNSQAAGDAASPSLFRNAVFDY